MYPRLYVSGMPPPNAPSPDLHYVLSRDAGKTKGKTIVHAAIPDNISPGMQWLARNVRLLSALYDAGESVLVRCEWGRSRSVMLATAFVMARERIGRDEALTRIRKFHPGAVPCEAFMDLLLQWEEMVR